MSSAPSDDVLRPSTSAAWQNRPSFGMWNRAYRLAWHFSWVVLCRWSPRAARGWRNLVLKLFGARIGHSAGVSRSAQIWSPRNLVLGDGARIGPLVNCYNMAELRVGVRTIISQGVFLCGGTHDIADPEFRLSARPISIGADAWVAAEAFVGPGVNVGDGAVLGARAVAFRDLEPWGVYLGNPAVKVKDRPHFSREKP